MDYRPITCVWEVTMGCNMRCGHCGSSCTNPLPDELNTDEALDVCGQIADMGLKWVTLSGGEPLTRKDITSLIRRLSERGVSVNIITNGWLLDMDMACTLKESGVGTVAISIDGTKEIHDKIRMKGAFEHAEQAFGNLKELKIKTGAVTTITKQNMDILSSLKEELIRMGVDTWQVQLGLPMGNLKERPDWLLEPEQVKDIIDFCYDTAKEGRIKIYPADCIGYYTKKEMEVKKISYETDMVSMWDGCNAGIRGFGILHNGEILGCTSIRNREYIEGSLRERPLREIWEDENAFSWRRNFTKDKLEGSCKTCSYGSKCLGGCPNTRLTMNGDIYSENQYCAYHLEMEKIEAKYSSYEDAKELLLLGEGLIKQEVFSEAAFALRRAAKLDSKNAQILKAKAYAEYMCGNYEICKEDNKKAIAMNEEDAYALRGYAIAVFRLGNKEEALVKMRKAVAFTSYADVDLMEDLRMMECIDK
ncbi:radical SAM protein with 4Fe4S-binding SPASM domain [Kineothrix alysoides]|uniref:Radical SAM protein with 4Fe4S-binding SPASM domain n=1 Tax=Kineothrix alysoides TaxID=1469948 RepID=A0A4R1R175_9FIRM|nr:radical SAM protein [Kineothrix alysoides]TCL59064.1 radical SAM protein with 4Fe4S-binding SPASM domain [Kineothrix alysoides]